LVISIDRPVNMPPADGIGGLNPSGRTEGERGRPRWRALRRSAPPGAHLPRFADDLQRRVDERNDQAGQVPGDDLGDLPGRPSRRTWLTRSRIFSIRWWRARRRAGRHRGQRTAGDVTAADQAFQ